MPYEASNINSDFTLLVICLNLQDSNKQVTIIVPFYFLPKEWQHAASVLIYIEYQGCIVVTWWHGLS